MAYSGELGEADGGGDPGSVIRGPWSVKASAQEAECKVSAGK